MINPFKESLVFKKMDYQIINKSISKLINILYIYKDFYYKVNQFYDEAWEINRIVKFAHELLKLDNYSCTVANAYKLLRDDEGIIIKLYPNDSKNNIRNINEYFNYIFINGNENVYLKGSEFNGLKDFLNQYRNKLSFKVINNIGQCRIVY